MMIASIKGVTCPLCAKWYIRPPHSVPTTLPRWWLWPVPHPTFFICQPVSPFVWFISMCSSLFHVFFFPSSGAHLHGCPLRAVYSLYIPVSCIFLFYHRGVVGHSQVLTNSRDTCVNTPVSGRLYAVMKDAVNPLQDQVIWRLTSLFIQEKNLMFVQWKVRMFYRVQFK